LETFNIVKINDSRVFTHTKKSYRQSYVF